MRSLADRRRSDPLAFDEAVRARIEQYSIAAAVEGTVGAIAAVVKRSGSNSTVHNSNDLEQYRSVRSLR
jgi:hypothetical protein